MLQDTEGVLLLIIWTPPFLGMFLLLALGGLLGLILSLKPWMDVLMMVFGIGGIVLLFSIPTLGLYLIPLGAGWVGFFIGRYYHHKAEIMGEHQGDEHDEEDLHDM